MRIDAASGRATNSTYSNDDDMADDPKTRMAQECFRKGTEAMAKQNWDYAIEMIGQSVKFLPSNLLFRQTLRGVEKKKYPTKGAGAKMAGMRLMGVKASIKKARMTRNWANLDQSAEEGLILVPWDAELNADVAEATANQGFIDVAVQAFRWSVDMDPNNKATLKSLGSLLEEKGEFLDAIKYWERVFKLDPLDMEARSKITQLNASSVIRDGEFEDEDGKGGYFRPTGSVETAASAVASGELPPPGWRTAGERAAVRDELDALADLLRTMRHLFPEELQQQLAEVLRQILLLLRALIDWMVDQLPPAVRGADVPLRDIPLA